MRYQNWDVLLFPGESRIPVQEFDTKCYVLQEQINELYVNTLQSVTQVPILTTFVASLENGSPFRISIHSWEKPAPSQLLSTFKTKEEIVMFEVRVYIDRVRVAQRTFGEQTTWPEVIDTVGNSTPESYTKALRFPPFHTEVLEQSHWEAGEGHGRIRVVLAEGILRERDLAGSEQYGFDKLRDVVAFSFQHVPKHVLELSGIAWPNPRMFRRPVNQQMQTGSITARIPSVTGFEAHSHSPQRVRPTSNPWPIPTQRERPFSTMPAFDFLNSSEAVEFWPLKERDTTAFHDLNLSEDPFVGPAHLATRGNKKEARNGSNNISMMDYHSATTRSDMSGVTYQPLDFHQQINNAAVEEIVKCLSPEKRHELFDALSPVKKVTTHAEPHTNNLDGTVNCKGTEDEVQGLAAVRSRRLSAMQKRDTGGRGQAAKEPRSTSANGPYLRASTLNAPNPSRMSATVRPGLLGGLGSSLSPTPWQDGDLALTELWSSSSRLNRTPRDRSSSNASKRKRAESPSNALYAKNSMALSLEAVNLEASMSTSPCKSTGDLSEAAGNPIDDEHASET